MCSGASGKKKGGAAKKGKGGAVHSSAGLPQYCGLGEGFADVHTQASKVVKSLKLSHKTLWVRTATVAVVMVSLLPLYYL